MTHTTALFTPVVEHWLEREIAQWFHGATSRSQDIDAQPFYTSRNSFELRKGIVVFPKKILKIKSQNKRKNQKKTATQIWACTKLCRLVYFSKSINEKKMNTKISVVQGARCSSVVIPVRS